MKITQLHARMILDSRGYPTVEVDMTLSDGAQGRASVPSGASTGVHEALELRDNDEHYGGKGVEKALSHIRNELAQVTLEKDFTSQRDFDTALLQADGTSNKSKYGANAILALSLAFAKASAASMHKELYQYIRDEYSWTKAMSLPMPLINVLNGGKHATASTDVQEWMIVPIGGTSFAHALEISAKVFYRLREIMATRGISTVGDEGGFPLNHATSNRDALVLLSQAVTESGLVLGKDIAFALDVASSEFFDGTAYTLACEHATLSQEEMISWIDSLTQEFPIISVEDGLAEDMWDSWGVLTERLGKRVQLVGDDLFVTNSEYIQKGIDAHAANAVLIKLNQIGTLSETADAIMLAQAHSLHTIISHRSGETEDTTIAHLAVASGSGQIKSGSLSRTERLAKYNELLRISETIKEFSNPFSQR